MQSISPLSAQLPSFGAGNDIQFAHRSERMQESIQSFDLSYDLSIEDPSTGRKASLSFDFSQLNATRSYDKFGIVGNIAGGALGPAGEFSAKEALEQGRFAMYAEHQEINIEATSFELEIDGDIELLQDYFSADKTAQRIIDFAHGLAGFSGAHGEELESVLEQITSGVQEGFRMAENILGGLHQISNDTESLVNLMLEQLLQKPEERPLVADARERLEELQALDEEATA